jgi:hypothetical protein
MPVPLLARRWHEIGEPVEKLKRREIADAPGPRPRGLPPATPPDPGGRLVPLEHVAVVGEAVRGTAVPTPLHLAGDPPVSTGSAGIEHAPTPEEIGTILLDGVTTLAVSAVGFPDWADIAAADLAALTAADDPGP